MLFFTKYFIVFAICVFLTSCGESSNRAATNQIGPLNVVKSSSGKKATVEQQYDVIRLLQGMFNAASGNMYLQEFAGLVANGTTLPELANMLAQTDAFKSPQLYPPTLSPQQFADKFVASLVGDTVNSVNKKWLADVMVLNLNNGVSRGEIIWSLVSTLVNVPTTDADWGRASAQFANKVEVAYYYSVTTAQSSADLGTLQAVTRSVTDDPATVIAAKAIKPANLAPSWATMGISGASRQTTVSWSKTTAATKAATLTTSSTYNLYWSTTSGVTKKTGNKIANVTSPYNHTGLTNGSTYHYVITEVVSGIEGPESLEAAVTLKATVPPAPVGVIPYPQDKAVQLVIDRSEATSSTKYNVYWSTSPTLSNSFKITNAFGGASVFLHKGLVNGTIYYYAVAAETPEGEGVKSKIVAAEPLADINAVNYQKNIRSAQLAAPKGVSATANNQQVVISWSMPSNQIPTIFDPDSTPTQSPVISAYNIYWSTTLITDKQQANKLTIPLSATATSALSFIHNTGISNNQSYYYVITASADVDANGNPLTTDDGKILVFESPASSQIRVVPESRAPIAPTGLSATSGAQQITLSWVASTTSDAVYHLYASDKVPAKPEDLVNPAYLIAITSAPSYIHTGSQYGTTYYYVVTAVTERESAPTNLVAIALR